MELKLGVLPVVVQDAETKDVLMLAYANKEALKRTFETGKAHYWSRSRKKLWMKGESSGNIQQVVEVRIDCDRDTILYIVKQEGVACHTGNYSCFFTKLEGVE
jgi:phosphoribosyl-AMP cyclohydrolase